MAEILPPAPVGAPLTSYTWADWYRKVRDQINNAGAVAWSTITGKPTTVAGFNITDAATLNASSRVEQGTDTTDDLIVDSNITGLVLKDNNATPHYWRVTVSTGGSLVVTDLGTTKP